MLKKGILIVESMFLPLLKTDMILPRILVKSMKAQIVTSPKSAIFLSPVTIQTPCSVPMKMAGLMRHVSDGLKSKVILRTMTNNTI
jgi:hypothetical protein